MIMMNDDDDYDVDEKSELICSRNDEEAILGGCDDVDDDGWNDGMVLLLRSVELLLMFCLPASSSGRAK